MQVISDISVPLNEDTYSAKVMIWDDLNVMRSLCSAVEVDAAQY